MNKYVVYWRTGYGVTEWRKPVLATIYVNMIYGVTLRESRYIRHVLGVFGTIQMWFIERRITNE
jgi:hypothetical protein